MLVLLPAVARADWEWPEANPARPSFSDNADVTQTGALEVEAGVATADDADAGVAQWTIKYGVARRFDVRVNLENTLWGTDLTLDGYGLLLKYTVRETAECDVGIAVEPYVNLARPRDGVDTGTFLVATYKREPFQIDACVVTDVVAPKAGDTQVTVSPIVALSFPIAGPLAGYVEPGIDLGVAGSHATNPYVGAGLAYAATKFLVFDAAFYVGDDPRTQFLAGLTYAMYVPPRRPAISHRDAPEPSSDTAAGSRGRFAGR